MELIIFINEMYYYYYYYCYQYILNIFNKMFVNNNNLCNR